MNCFAYILSPHVGKPLYGFGKTLDGVVRISMFKTIPDTVLDVTLQHYLSTAVKGGFCGVDLCQNIFAGHILIDHSVNGLYLADNFLESPVKILRVHALSHMICASFFSADSSEQLYIHYGIWGQESQYLRGTALST